MSTYGDQATTGSLDLSQSNSVYDAAKSTGENAINSFDPTSTANSQKSSLGSSGLGGLLGGETNDYTSAYTQAVKNNPTVQSLYQTGNQLYNVGPLARTANYLTNEMTDTIPEEVQGARGYDIGSPQITNAAATREAYLGPQAGRAVSNYNTASGLASQFVQSGLAQNQQNLLPIQAQGALVGQQENLQGSGWNQAMANEFQALVSKMNAGVTLSQAEIQRANQLAAMLEAFQQQQISNAASLGTAQIGQQYKILNPAQTLVNTFTGGMQTV